MYATWSSSSTMMASPPAKKSRIHRWLEAPRRGFNRILPNSHTPALSSANIANEDPGVQPAALLGTDSADVEGNRSQDASFPTFYQQSSSHPETTNSNKIKKAWGVTRSGLLTTLRLLEKSADVFPPLKSAVGGLVACLDLAQVVAGNHEEYEKLAMDLTNMANALAPYVTRLVTEDASGSVGRIMESIKAELAHIGQQQDRGKIMRTVEANQDQGDVIQRYRRIESLFRQLQSDISLRIWEDTRKLRDTSLLKDLSPVVDARYDSNYSMALKRRGCTAETRKKILKDIQDWVEDPNGTRIYWMSGMAGTGKTTILYSLCDWLSKKQLLGGNYFCSRISTSCRDANTIVPTLSYHLARYSPAFRSALCKVLEENPEASKLDVRWQFEKLLQAPMQAVKAAMPEGVVVVIDALDECDDGEAFRLFLDILLKLAVDLPIKFLITSRPEPAIREKMLAPGHSRSVLYLHDIEEWIVEGDIKKYLTEALGSLSPPPSPNDVEQLAKRAGKLFIYAATAVRYIYPRDPGVNSNARLRTVLRMDSRSTKQHDELNELYTSILSAAIDPKRLEEQEMDDIRLTLKTVVCAKEPMSVQTLVSLLSLTEEQVRFSLQPLRSILHVQDSIHGLVSPFHASFPDYLLDKLRSGDFHCEATEHSEVLANCCFDLMKEQLRFNICELESSFVFDEDVLDLQDRMKKFISPALSYSCRYWGEHLRQGNFTDTAHERLVDFLIHRLLFWMEVINLERHMGIGIEMLHEVHTWLKGFQINTRKQVADAEAFTTRFAAGACARSTPHIYISGLPFCPRSSSVHENYWRRTQGLIDVRGSLMEQWPSAAIGIWKADSSVHSVACSPDGKRIVSGSHDQTIRVWDARTGDTVAGPFDGHTNWVRSVAFSPDSTRIVSGSSDQTIRVWDARTGDTVSGSFKVKGHTDSVLSVAFSPCDTRIVSGSSDETIRVWDAHTGATVAGPFKGHTDSVRSVAFSPDGTRIVSGSSDQTIRVWNARTGDTYAGPFKGHTDLVYSVAFSPDSTRIASGSRDQTIRVWDARTGDTVAGPFKGHTNAVTSAVISPDGIRIVSGSCDRTIRVWDARTGDTVAGPFEGHTESVMSVAISPDGTRIVSGSFDQTIRVWDARTGDTVAGPFIGHTDSVWSVAFSPDSTRIVSGSSDHTIRVWDVRTGDTVAGPFKGHTNWVSSVAFSPDGTRLVSGSFDQTIRVRDAHTGATVAGPFTGHNHSVSSVAFSPDGTRIVSGSYDETIRVWDARTGDTVAGPFKGHTDLVSSVAFSPDGMCIVSGSYDETIRIWDARTGGTVTENDISVDTSTLSPHLHSDDLCMDNFTFKQDGWITAHNVPLFWISPHFRTQLPYPRNTLVIGPQGTTLIDYSHLCIGEKWSDCYLS